jgi:flagellar motor switch protein FliN
MSALQPRSARAAPAVREFIEMFAQTAGTVFSQAFSGDWKASFETVASEAVAPEEVWLAFESPDPLPGEMAFRIAPAQAVRLAQLFLGETSPAAETAQAVEVNDEQRECVGELFRQVCGRFESALKPKHGAVSFKEPIAAAGERNPGTAVARITVAGGAETLSFEIHLSMQMVASLQMPPAESASPPTGAAAATPTASANPNVPAAHAPSRPSQAESAASTASAVSVCETGNTRNLDLLFGIELRATLRFGQRRMSLRDVLQLNSGSVVDLDRRVEEPVELLVDDAVIARGQVVVIDGNYGLRITEVAGAQGN